MNDPDAEEGVDTDKEAIIGPDALKLRVNCGRASTAILSNCRVVETVRPDDHRKHSILAGGYRNKECNSCKASDDEGAQPKAASLIADSPVSKRGRLNVSPKRDKSINIC